MNRVVRDPYATWCDWAGIPEAHPISYRWWGRLLDVCPAWASGILRYQIIPEGEAEGQVPCRQVGEAC